MFLLQAQKLGPKLAFFLLRHRRRGRAVTGEANFGGAPGGQPGTAGASCRRLPSLARRPSGTKSLNLLVPPKSIGDPKLSCVGDATMSHERRSGKLSLRLSRFRSLHFIDYPNKSQRIGAQRGFSPCDKGSILAVGHVGIESHCLYARGLNARGWSTRRKEVA
jgi:hypothetical protein